MIDFRYHLVSLVSVFLALAVGIVLGAGPLKDSIGNTLTSQVQGLRQQKDTLRTELDTSNTSLQHRDSFITDVGTSLISAQLTGRSVVIVVLPGVRGDIIQPLVDAVATAGGTVTGRVSLNGSWVDPAKADARTQVLTGLVSKLPAGTPTVTGTTDDQLTELLADSLVTTGAPTVGHAGAASSTVLSSLRSGDLIDVKGDLTTLAGAALVIAPENGVADGKTEPTASDNALTSYVDLATTLDKVGGGAVVTGPLSSAADGGVLSSVRKDGTAKSRVSTVDSGETPMGVITAMLALREQLAGGSGAYGFGNGVNARLPTLPAAATGTSPPTATASAK